MRDFLLVDVGDDCRVRGRAQHVEEEGDLVTLDQPADLLHSFRRLKAVVVIDVFYLPTGDASLFVDHLEEGFLNTVLNAERRDWPR